jgi:hypothetical protein
MPDNILYADQELNSNDFFVITPEGNYFNFPADKFNENSDDFVIIDTRSHKPYTVKFHE